MKKKYSSKKCILFLLPLLVVLVGTGIVIFLHQKQSIPKKEFRIRKQQVVEHVDFFGEQNQYVYLKLSPGGYDAHINLGKKYFVTFERRFQNTSSERPLDGWYWYAYIYDIEQKEPSAQKVDLYALVKKYDSSYYLNQQGTILYQDGKEYQILELRKSKDDSSKFVLLNLESHQIEDNHPRLQNLKYAEQYRIGSLAMGANIFDQITKSGFLQDRDSLIVNSENDIVETNNFAKEYPDILKKIRINSDKSYIGFRQGLVSAEDEYQTLRHWFAPVGQDKLEVIGTNSYTGETKVLNTYDEFQEWGAWNKNKQKNN